jgi:WD40 repeat protein
VARVGGALPAGVAAVQGIYLFNLMLSLDQGEGEAARLDGLVLSDFLSRLATEDGEHWEYQPGPAAAPGTSPAPAGDTPPQRFVLIIDQFEEIITTHPERWRERESFFRALDQAMRDDPNLWVVLALREDYVAALDPYAQLMTDRLRARFYMERMGADAALEAVREPAELGGRPFAPGVAQKLVDDLRQVRVPGQDATLPGPYVEPVQLQVVCYQLWEGLTDGAPGPITEADLAEAGDVNEALGRFYEDTLAAALAEPAVADAGVTAPALRRWFDRELITETGIRGTVYRNEAAGRTGTLANVAVDALAQRFLIRTELRAGGAWVELVHDRFVEPIRERNAAWFAQNLSVLQRQASLWEEQGRSAGLLLSGEALAEAEAWANARAAELDEVEREFLEQCRQARHAAERDRRQTRRIRALAMAAAVIAIAAVALALVAFGASDRARTAEASARSAQEEAQVAATRALEARGTAQAEATRALGAEANAVSAQETAEASAAEAERQQIAAQQNARRAKAGELAAAAQLEMAKPVPDPSISLLLAREAVSATWPVDGYVTDNASRAIVDAIQKAPPWVMNLPHDWYVGPIISAAYSPGDGGGRIVTANFDDTAKVWDAASGEELLTLSGHAGQVFSATFSPDGGHIVTASDDGTAKVWDAASGRELLTFSGHVSPVNSAAYSPDGARIVTASDDGTARIWDADDGKEVLTLRGPAGAVKSASYSPDGARIVTGHGFVIRAGTRAEHTVGAAIVWDAESGVELLTFPEQADESESAPYRSPTAYNSATYSPDGKHIVTASSDDVVKVWDAESASELLTVDGHAASYSPDGTRLVTAKADKTATVWNAVSGQELQTLSGHGGVVNTAAFSPDGTRIVTASDDGKAKVWQLAPDSYGDAEVEQPLLTLSGRGEPVSSAVYDPGGTRIVTIGDYAGSAAKVWDATTGEEVLTLRGSSPMFDSLAYRPDGKRIVTVGIGSAAQIDVLDAADGRQLLSLPVEDGGFVSAAYSPDGSRLVTVQAHYDNAAQTWRHDATIRDAENGSPLLPLATRDYEPRSASYSPNGLRILTTGCVTDDSGACTLSAIKVWNAAIGQELLILPGRFARFSPDGARIVTLGSDSNSAATVWDASSGKKRLTLAGHPIGIESATFSPDGARVMTAGCDQWDIDSSCTLGTVKLWDAVSGDLVMTLSGHGCNRENNCGVLSALFSPDGARIVTVGADRTVRVWPGSPDEMLKMARQGVQRDGPTLTPEERVQYGLD